MGVSISGAILPSGTFLMNPTGVMNSSPVVPVSYTYPFSHTYRGADSLEDFYISGGSFNARSGRIVLCGGKFLVATAGSSIAFKKKIEYNLINPGSFSGGIGLSTGDYIVLGSYGNTPFLTKLDVTGNVVWCKTINFSVANSSIAFAELPDGNVVFTGGNCRLTKINVSNGTVVWRMNAFGSKIEVNDSESKIYVSGYSGVLYIVNLDGSAGTKRQIYYNSPTFDLGPVGVAKMQTNAGFMVVFQFNSKMQIIRTDENFVIQGRISTNWQASWNTSPICFNPNDNSAFIQNRNGATNSYLLNVDQGLNLVFARTFGSTFLPQDVFRISGTKFGGFGNEHPVPRSAFWYGADTSDTSQMFHAPGTSTGFPTILQNGDDGLASAFLNATSVALSAPTTTQITTTTLDISAGFSNWTTGTLV
jgi:hypothetical protein